MTARRHPNMVQTSFRHNPIMIQTSCRHHSDITETLFRQHKNNKNIILAEAHQFTTTTKLSQSQQQRHQSSCMNQLSNIRQTSFRHHLDIIQTSSRYHHEVPKQTQTTLQNGRKNYESSHCTLMRKGIAIKQQRHIMLQ